MAPPIESSPPTRPELVIALVCPLGARIDALEESIPKALEQFKYTTEHIRLSDLLRDLASWTDEADRTEEARLENRQRHAADFREIGGFDALARAAIMEIRKRRSAMTGSPDRAASGVAYLLRQIKRPEEIRCLRRVYGPSLLVIAGHAPEEVRTDYLAGRLARTAGKASPGDIDKNKARMLINTDHSDDSSADDKSRFGQNTRDAYPLADFFVDLSAGAGGSVRRFLDLIFGHPFHSPTAEEIAMHQANAMSLRSSDERRQVGAVIVKRTPRGAMLDQFADATVVASGMNEVPRRQGGYYWDSESPDGRDQYLRYGSHSFDREEQIKSTAVGEIAERLRANKWLAPEVADLSATDLRNRLLKLLDRTQFSSISEFMRQVHAEMAAIVDAAMRGVPVRECELYVTAFPCHGCAKHIIAAGITKVVFLEPYPKSRAEALHREEIALDPWPRSSAGDRVLFIPFTGVAPRQFGGLFSMTTRGRKHGLSLEAWRKQQGTLTPRLIIARADLAYIQAERDELRVLPEQFKWDKEALAPSSAPT